MPQITERRYEQDGRVIEFEELPQDEAENVVCAILLAEITGEYDSLARLYADGENEAFAVMIENAKQNYAEDLGYAQITVQEVKTLAQDELLAYINPANGLPLLAYFHERAGTEQTYESYVNDFWQQGNRVVHLVYDCRYTEKSSAAAMQIADGERNVFFRLMPTQKGLAVKEDTTIYKDFIPKQQG